MHLYLMLKLNLSKYPSPGWLFPVASSVLRTRAWNTDLQKKKKNTESLTQSLRHVNFIFFSPSIELNIYLKQIITHDDIYYL